MRIAVASQKGGSGKTTTCINLAGAAAAAHRRVIILDADPQGTADAWRSIRTEAGLGQPDVRRIQAANVARELADCSLYDVVIIDTAPHAEYDLTVVAAAVDLVLVPVRPSMPDLAAFPAVLSIVKASGKRGAAVLSSVPPRAPEEVEAREALESFGLHVAPGALYERRAVARSLASGQTIGEYEPDSPAVAEAAALYKWLLTEVKK